jgi:hypothetical protein
MIGEEHIGISYKANEINLPSIGIHHLTIASTETVHEPLAIECGNICFVTG